MRKAVQMDGYWVQLMGLHWAARMAYWRVCWWVVSWEHCLESHSAEMLVELKAGCLVVSKGQKKERSLVFGMVGQRDAH